MFDNCGCGCDREGVFSISTTNYIADTTLSFIKREIIVTPSKVNLYFGISGLPSPVVEAVK
jgi:hypothetical protein